MTKQIISALAIFTILACMPFSAQAQRMSEAQRKKALTEMRNFKHTIFVQELELAEDQQNKFFEIYDAMDEELFDLAEEIRVLERKVSTDPNATDTERLAAARALFEQHKREGAIEMKYFDQLAEVLTPAQLLKLKPAERQISMRMARYHGHKRSERKTGK